MRKINAVLFDLDGTLLDTAPDLANVLNAMRSQRQLPALPLSLIKPAVGSGSNAMMKLAFDLDNTDHDYPLIVEQFFNLYMDSLAEETTLFPGMESVLTHLENNGIRWGIVTNKPARFTDVLLDKLALSQRSACVISGDTLDKRKPHPAPILHACELLDCKPAATLYIGDTVTDVIASKAAGTIALAALYGYISPSDDPPLWQADGYIHKPVEIIDWVK